LPVGAEDCIGKALVSAGGESSGDCRGSILRRESPRKSIEYASYLEINGESGCGVDGFAKLKISIKSVGTVLVDHFFFGSRTTSIFPILMGNSYKVIVVCF
jgi:hypothetical protein